MVELSQIDDALARFADAERRITANLVELDDHPTYTLLKASAPSGETGRRFGAALAAGGELWQLHSSLRETLDRVRELRETEGRMTAERRTQMADLLWGPSVLVAVGQTPLEQRDLLGASSFEQRCTLEQLLGRMRQLYEPLRDAVAHVDALWREMLPRAEAATSTLNRLEREAAQLGLVGDAQLSALRRHLDDVQRALADDPLSLGGPSAADGLDEMVRAAADRISALRHGHDALDSDLATTESTLAELRSLRASAAAAHSEATAKITGVSGLVRVPSPDAIDGLGGLADQLDAVRDSTASTPWQARRRQLDAWLETARRFRDQLSRAVTANQAPLARRDELRGLLTAYRAKAAMVGRAEDLALGDLADRAHNELYTSPTDLEVARDLVEEMGAALLARAAATSPRPASDPSRPWDPS